MLIFWIVEDFFISFGLDFLLDSFWEKLMLFRLMDGWEVICYFFVWDLGNSKDFRLF